MSKAEVFCEDLTILEGTEYGITLATAESQCKAQDVCSYLTLHRPESPVPSYAWLCSGSDWTKRQFVEDEGETISLVAVDLERNPLENFDLKGNLSGECPEGSLLESTSGYFIWENVGKM
eukprot:Blabericola_migrator_1__4058@NODE_2237_length_3072_cov_107_794010_g1073_i1_p2_GENE_NODE_2237_length_3072_cov_107_794010_g1073_i1NODE_2237_length_3072_cov_107_794010_g1073_i1_p2_ORF_typecomplete_len120_score24_22_NODE_2237_length_3072_cov_107_794010_g1073_i117732132